MSRTVSARIPTELHEDLRDRCNQLGESINDFVKASIEFCLYGNVEFDFGNGWNDERPEEHPKSKSPRVHTIRQSDSSENVPRVKLHLE